MTTLDQVVDPTELAAAIAAGHVSKREHPVSPYAILNYTDKCQYERGWNRTTLTTRGLIYNTETGIVIARSWPKFFNYGEPEAPALDLDAPATVTDKIDGSLGILYHSRTGWAIATRGSFTSDQGIHATDVYRRRYADFIPPFGYTVLFEIVYPENRIVCDYGDQDDLILLGAVETSTGASVGPRDVLSWHGPRATTYSAHTLREALALPPRPGAEGVVVRVGDNTVKLKQADYIALHRIVTGLNARVVWEHLGNGGTVAELCEPLPDEFHGWVQSQAAALLDQHEQIVNEATVEYLSIRAELGEEFERRDYAAIASRSSNRAWLFMLLDGKNLGKKVWQTLRPSGEVRPLNITEDAA